jgi:uncharacterized protein (TIGR00730 family)
MAAEKKIDKICVYCASSRKTDRVYLEAAYQLGQTLAHRGITTVYGGGAVGSMGALADGALAAGGQVIGILPEFMQELEWGHNGLTELRIVSDLRERKQMMIGEADAIVALPGGSGTLEELFETITLKRLGFFVHPIVLVNLRSYYDHLISLFDRAVAGHFMDARHLRMWTVVNGVEDVLRAIDEAPVWSVEARKFAAV